MELPEVNVKFVGAVVGIIAFMIVAWIWNPWGTKMVDARFVSSTVSFGQNTTLLVTVTNTMGGDVNLLTVSIDTASYDNSVITFTKTSESVEIFASGDVRTFSFPLYTSPSTNIESGVYHVTINVDMDTQRETATAALEVKK